jgi:hypothetical protein
MWIVGAWLELPVLQQFLALGGFYATTGVALHLLAYHSPVSDWTRSFRGVVAPFFVSVALIFGLLLGFVAGEVWHRNADAAHVVRSEGEALFELVHLSQDTDPAGTKIQGLVRAYAQSLVGVEWPRMQEGKHAAESEAAFVSLLTAILDAPVSGNSGSAVQRARLDIAMKLHALRETRIDLASDRTDEIKWATLLILGLVSQLAIAAVHLEMPRPQIAALTIFSTAAIIGLGLVAIQEGPFSPPIEVSPAPLEEVVHEIPVR